jgi:hypothetical protein
MMVALKKAATAADKAAGEVKSAGASQQYADAMKDSEESTKDAATSAAEMHKNTVEAATEIQNIADKTSKLVQEASQKVSGLQLDAEKRILEMGTQISSVGSVAGANLKAKEEGHMISESASAANTQINTWVNEMRDENSRVSVEFTAAGNAVLQEISEVGNKTLSKGTDISKALDEGASRSKAELATAAAAWRTAEADAVSQVAEVAKKAEEDATSASTSESKEVEGTPKGGVSFSNMFGWFVLGLTFATATLAYHYWRNKA